MQKLVKAFENMMVAVTFAESGEYDAVRRITGQKESHEVTVLVSKELKPVSKS